MKALAWFGADDVRVIEAGIPDIVDPDDVVLVSVLATEKKFGWIHAVHRKLLGLRSVAQTCISTTEKSWVFRRATF